MEEDMKKNENGGMRENEKFLMREVMKGNK